MKWSLKQRIGLQTHTTLRSLRLYGKLETEGDRCGDVTHPGEEEEMSTNGGYVMGKAAGLGAAGGDKGKHIEQEH